jgi:hypothetical protein
VISYQLSAISSQLSELLDASFQILGSGLWVTIDIQQPVSTLVSFSLKSHTAYLGLFSHTLLLYFLLNAES